MANKLLGQHFVKDRAALRAIVRAVSPQRGDVIVEIGAGHGELTAPLAAACAKDGGELIAIEKDRLLAERLRERFPAAAPAAVRVIEGDAIEFLRSDPIMREIAGTKKPFKLAGNIPYYLTGRLLRVIGTLSHQPARCVFMLQKEVAERLVSVPPRMNRLAASVRFWSEPKIVAAVPRTHFRPSPRVDSAVVAFAARRAKLPISAEEYYAALRAVFAQPRKTILNNVVARRSSADKQNTERTLLALGIIPGSRPQDLTIDSIVAVAKAFRGKLDGDN